MTSANVQMPVLFTIADTDGATLFGEGVTNDLIDNHLEFLLDRSAAFEAPGYDASLATSSLANAFRDTFFVGDPATTAAPQKLFFVNMIAGQGTATVSKKQFTPAGSDARDATASEVVDMFCNKLAHALLKLSPDNKGLEHVPSASKLIPVGGRATITTFDTSVAPSASEKLNVGDVMARVASVHLVGHPLAQDIFANEDEIKSLYETKTFDEALQHVREGCDIAALTRSENGAVIVSGEEVHVLDAEPVANLADTTGAGDAFAAGFLFGFTQEMPLDKCGRIGAIVAAETIQHMGARPDVSFRELVENTLEESLD